MSVRVRGGSQGRVTPFTEGMMPSPWDDIAVTDGPTISDRDSLADYPYYNGEWVMPRSASPSPPEPHEIQVSGTARNTQFPILIGNTRITCDLMGYRYATPGNFLYLAYRVGEAPPGGLSSITNIKINGEDVSVGAGSATTGISWVSRCFVEDGAQDQTVNTFFSGLNFNGYAWRQRHQGTAWIGFILDLTYAPVFSTLPVVTCEFDAGNITDWASTSRALSNPVAALYYYMNSERFGFDVGSGKFNAAEWTAAAAHCDTSISGEPRWSVHGGLTGQSSQDIILQICKHAYLAVWYWGDEWHIGYLKTHSTAAATAAPADFAESGALKYTNTSKRKLPNRMMAWFTDDENEQDDVRVAEASGILPSNLREAQIRLDLCRSPHMAYRWAQTYIGVMQEEALIGRCTLRPGVAKNLAPYERLDITSDLGFTDSTWRVTGINAVAGGFLECELRKYSPTALSTGTSDPVDSKEAGYESGAPDTPTSVAQVFGESGPWDEESKIGDPDDLTTSEGWTLSGTMGASYSAGDDWTTFTSDGAVCSANKTFSRSGGLHLVKLLAKTSYDNWSVSVAINSPYATTVSIPILSDGLWHPYYLLVPSSTADPRIAITSLGPSGDTLQVRRLRAVTWNNNPSLMLYERFNYTEGGDADETVLRYEVQDRYDRNIIFGRARVGANSLYIKTLQVGVYPESKLLATTQESTTPEKRFRAVGVNGALEDITISTQSVEATDFIQGLDTFRDNDLKESVRIGEISNTNYFEISTKGHVTLVGDATVWEDLRFPALSLTKIGNADPDAVNFRTNGSGSKGVYTYGFDKAIEQELFCIVQMPHQWKVGSNIYFHIHWLPQATGAGEAIETVRWGIEYSWVNIGKVDGVGTSEITPLTTIVYAEDSDDPMTSKEHRMVNFSAVSGTGKTMSSILFCRIFRDATHANDNYDYDALLAEFDIHYEIDSLGSNTVSSKT